MTMSIVFVNALVLLHAWSTFSMTAIVGYVQVLGYPLFLYVGPAEFKSYHQQHMKRISFLVVPLMLMQLFSATLLVGTLPDEHWLGLNSRWLLLGLSVAVFVLTFAISVPLHSKLEQQWNERTIRKLVRTNIYRTVVWFVHSAFLLVMMLEYFVSIPKH